MRQYQDLVSHILDKGSLRADRTGVGTKSVFGYQMRFDLEDGFPLLTTKRVNFKSVASELLWFLSGSTDVARLRSIPDAGCHIWDPWVRNGDTDLGPIYGAQWRRWKTLEGHVDQIAEVIEEIKSNPTSRRLIVSAWNVADLPFMRLPPCHLLFQFYVADGRLSCQLYQRSADVFIGVPFNIASYALLTMMIAHVTRLRAGEFVHTLGDAHLYLNHLEQAREQLLRSPRALPKLQLNADVTSIDDFAFKDFTLEGYEPHPHIKAPVAV